MAGQFVYKLLDADLRQIRLLRIEDVCQIDDNLCPYVSGDQDPISIRCRMEVVSLLDTTSTAYCAISYTWGKSLRLKKVEINGQVLAVPYSSVVALRGTHLATAPQGMLVWIDAICVNQRDSTEKAEQVSMMGEIYSRAEDVLVWLGEDVHEIAETAITSMEAILLECRSLTNDLENLHQHIDPDRRLQYTDLSYRTQPLPQPCDCSAIFGFFGAPWFKRLWTVQEVVLARHASCYLGAVTVPLAVVTVCALWWVHRTPTSGYPGTGNLDDLENCVSGIVNASYIYMARHGGSRGFYELVERTRLYNTSEPLDRIYAICALVDRNNPTTDIALSRFYPDYKKDVADVYSDALLVAIEEKCDLSILLDTEIIFPRNAAFSAVENMPNLPSWVPWYFMRGDWGGHNGPTQCFPRNPHVPGADNAMSLINERNEDFPRSLRLKGVVLSTISCRGEKALVNGNQSDHGPSSAGDPNVTAISLFIDEIFTEGSAHNYQNQGHYLANQIAHALVTGVYEGGAPALLEDFKAYMWVLTQRAEKIGLSNRGLKRLHDFCASQYGAFRPLEQAMQMRSQGRVLIQVANGQIGLGAPYCAVDDYICILFGSNVPHVMRREGSHWRLIGAAYFFGIMRGEYVKKLQQDDSLHTKVDWFEIH